MPALVHVHVQVRVRVHVRVCVRVRVQYACVCMDVRARACVRATTRKLMSILRTISRVPGHATRRAADTDGVVRARSSYIY